MRLRSKMLLVWGGFVLLLWGATLWSIERTLDQNFTQLSGQAFDGARQGLRAMQEERVKRMRQASSLVMNIPELRALIAEHNYELEPANLVSLVERLDALAKTLDAAFVCVLDNRGNVIAQNRGSPWQRVPALQEYFGHHAEAASLIRNIFQPNQPAGDVYGLWSTDSGLMQAVGVPLVFGGDDNDLLSPPPDGALLIASPITNELASELASSHGCQLTFFTGRNVVATSFADRRSLGQLSALLTLKRGEETVVAGVSYRVCSEPLRDPCSGMIVGSMLIQRNQDDAQAVRREVSRSMLAIMCGGLAMMALGCYFLSGAIVRPITELLNGVNRVAGGDLSPTLSQNRKDELGRLAAAFNDMVRQIAARRELERQMEETKATSRAKSQFLANMSHEIRTPLNGVIGIADLMLHTDLTERQRRYVGLVKSSAEVLTTLVNDALDFAKIEAGKMELESIDFDLYTVIEEVVEMFAPRVHAKGLGIICDIDGKLARTTRGDPNRLRQVIINLLNNAIKFTQSGQIVIRAAPDSSDPALMKVSVTDSGIGIPHDRLDRLFRAFSQVDASTTRRYGGTGLGLAICKELAELLGGSIGVESQINAGSTFWFTARLKPTERLQLPPLYKTHWRGVKVLVAERDPKQQEVLAARLTEWGFHVRTVSKEGELLSVVRSEAFDLAIIGQFSADRSAFDSAKVGSAKMATLALLRSDQEIPHDQLRDARLRGYVTQPLRHTQMSGAIAMALLPADVVPALEQAPASPCATIRSTARILLADDQEVNQLVVVDMLDQCGFDCKVVSDGLQVCEAASRDKFELILMDCQMPGMDGLEAARKIRERERKAGCGRVPILALTANADGRVRAECIDAGMDDLCTKPIHREQLINAIRSLLNDPAQSGAPQPAGSTRGTARSPSAEPVRDAEPARTESCQTGSALLASDPAPIDLHAVLRRCSGKPALAEKVLGRFAAQADAAVAGISACIASADAPSVARFAHSLKGTAGMAAATDLQAIASRLEELSKCSSLAVVSETFEQLSSEVARCTEYIARVPPRNLPLQAACAAAGAVEDSRGD